jgi:hypothetical protein
VGVILDNNIFVIFVGGNVLKMIGTDDEEPPVFIAVTTIFSPNVSSGDTYVNVADGTAVRELSVEGLMDTPLRVNEYEVAPTPPVQFNTNPDTPFSTDDVI